MKSTNAFTILLVVAIAVLALFDAAESNTKPLPVVVDHFAFTGSSDRLGEGANFLKILSEDIRRGAYRGMSITITGSFEPGDDQLTIHVW